MKTLKESILSSNNAGRSYFTDKIKNAIYNKDQINLLELTFEQFLRYIDKVNMAKFLQRCYADAKGGLTDMGKCTFYFKDGNLGIEIYMKPNGMFRNSGKVFREAFVPKEELREQDPNKIFGKDNFVNVYNYQKYFHNDIESFTTEWGDRLKNVVDGYIEHLRNNYDKIVQKK